MTHEPEITEPVDLCTPDGERLNPAARGWSRRPLHRCNLFGPEGANSQQGRNKRWDYWAVLAGDVVVSAVYANIDYLAFADVWWADLSTGESGGGATGGLGGDGFPLPERPGTEPLHAKGDGFELSLVDHEGGTRLAATWRDQTGVDAQLDIEVARPRGHESLNVVIPWSDDTFNFTSKHQARPATGWLQVGDRRWVVGGERDAWGVLDVGRGRWPAEIRWNWGGGAGRSGSRVIGVQFGAKWTEGSGFTENGILVDGQLTKIGNELEWTYDWDRPMEPWRVVDPDGQIDLVLQPRYDKHTKIGGGEDDGDEGSETHQVFGTWTGRVVTDDGVGIDIADLQGFAEEARQRW
jgi:hypothetical protein